MKQFGTDGIRKLAEAFFLDDFALHVGKALAVLGNPYLIIAQDSRESSEAIKKMVVAGAEKQGMKVYDMGLLPTPVLSFLSYLNQTIGVMITASHNPYPDNGIKIIVGGKKLSSNQEQTIESLLKKNSAYPMLLPVKEKDISLLPYVQKYADLHLDVPFKVGFDVANGAGSSLVPHLVKRFIRTAQFIHTHPDGRNINEQCGSTHLESITAFVQEKSLDIGFALDGDGDRVLVVDKHGKTYDGDMQIFIVATYLQSIQALSQSKVVLSVMSNLGVIQALKRKGIEVVSTPVGDKYIMQAIDEQGLTLGGEASGHVINKYLLNSGDGTLNALFLLKIMAETGKTLEQLVEGVVRYPEKLVNLKNIDRSVLDKPAVQAAIQSYQAELKDEAKIVVRASGTEPLIRISVCAKTQELVDEYIQKIIQDITH